MNFINMWENCIFGRGKKKIDSTSIAEHLFCMPLRKIISIVF